MVKPDSDQAVTLELGYDQKVKLDLSGVANEKLTLVHIGEKLIILFDNQSTVTVHPFFDSMGVPLSNVSVSVSSGRDLPSGEFVSTVPISTDTTLLPTAGPGTAATEKSGAILHRRPGRSAAPSQSAAAAAARTASGHCIHSGGATSHPW